MPPSPAFAQRNMQGSPYGMPSVVVGQNQQPPNSLAELFKQNPLFSSLGKLFGLG
jgi:hypothetical protein